MINTISRSLPGPAARQGLRSWLGWFAVLVAALLIAVALSVTFGARAVSWAEVFNALQGRVDTIGEAAVATRIPRTVLAILAGAALALSGAAMQGVTRNPLADPGILGINAGAALAVVIGIAWFQIEEATLYVTCAVVGAGVTAVFVYTIGSLGYGGATPLKLALAGAASSAAIGSLTTAIVLPRGDISGLVRSWQIGGVGGATFDGITPVLPFLGVGFIVTLLSARRLNMLALGDDTAVGLGERVARARATGAFGAILLCGATTAVCGPIGFVGLVIPHLCRLIVGPDYRVLMPFAALAGAVLLVVADVVGRIIARPEEIDVGIITAFIGAPVFIWIVRQRRVREL